MAAVESAVSKMTAVVPITLSVDATVTSAERPHMLCCAESWHRNSPTSFMACEVVAGGLVVGVFGCDNCGEGGI